MAFMPSNSGNMVPARGSAQIHFSRFAEAIENRFHFALFAAQDLDRIAAERAETKLVATAPAQPVKALFTKKFAAVGAAVSRDAGPMSAAQDCAIGQDHRGRGGRHLKSWDADRGPCI